MRLGALTLAAVCVFVLACSSTAPLPTPSSASATPGPTSAPNEPTASATPLLEAPEPPAAVSVLGEGTILLEIQPGGRQFIEPLQLAQTFGSPPACAGFAFVFRYRMDDDATVRFEGQLQGTTAQVIEGSEGGTTTGCMVLEAVNDGEEPVTGVLRYLIGAFR